jgi:cellulose synthase/poly-beta-1,6-N-acetylglucosamine synthase-like glycosyltransferase
VTTTAEDLRLAPGGERIRLEDAAALVGRLRGRRARRPVLPRAGPYVRTRANGLALFVVLSLGVFLYAKAEFREPTSSTVFYLYGVTVTSLVLVQMAIAFGRYRDLAVDAASLPVFDPPLVSCIVAVHNEEEVIAQCLRSLAAQTYGAVELIAVDDCSTDRTPELLAELGARYGVTVVRLSENVGKKKALEAGILRSAGEILAFTDSDSVWALDALERTVDILLTNPDVGAVSGHCRALNASENLLTRIQDSWYEGQFSVRKAFESAFGAVTCVSGPLAVFRREAIYNYVPAWAEDAFLGDEFRFATDRMLTGFVLCGKQVGSALKARHAGSPFLEPDYPERDWQIVYSSSAKAWTVVPNSLRRLVRQQIRWKKSFIRNTFFTGRFYWRRPFVPALAYYLHVLFVACGPLVAFRHLVYVPLRGNPNSGLLYLVGIVVVGSMFGVAHWRVEPESRHWMLRPLMSLLSTFLFSWLLFYSLATIKQMRWARD